MARNKRVKRKIINKITGSVISNLNVSKFYEKEHSKILKKSEVTINGVQVIHPGYLGSY